MKRIFMVSLIILTLSSLVFALPAKQSTTLSWTAPTTNADGTPLTNLGGYKIYYSTTPGGYTNPQSKDIGNVLTTTTQAVTGSSTTVYYFVVTAYNTAGNESDFSNEVRNSIPLVPAVPGGLSIN